MEMNKPTIVMQTITSSAIGAVVNFFILRGVLHRVNKPRGAVQQAGLAALVSLLLLVPSILRQVAPLRDAAATRR